MTPSCGPEILGHTLCGGEAAGPALRLTAPLSLWGGVDPATGTIIETSHPQMGSSLAGSVVVMPGMHGSSGGGSTLLECVARNTAPSAVLLTAPSQILLVGALVAREVYGVRLPIVLLAPDAAEMIPDGQQLRVSALAQNARLSIGT